MSHDGVSGIGLLLGVMLVGLVGCGIADVDHSGQVSVGEGLRYVGNAVVVAAVIRALCNK